MSRRLLPWVGEDNSLLLKALTIHFGVALQQRRINRRRKIR